MIKILFASLLCHRDVEIFKFNWFSSRIHLDHGFDIPHLILSDGTLTEFDIKSLQELPNIIIDLDPITLFDVPKPFLVAKIECFERGFFKYNYDRIVILDAGDVFFFRSWDCVLRKIIISDAICLRDWSSSIGWNVTQFKEVFGVIEDLENPCCNTGIYSIPRNLYYKIPPILEKHKAHPFHIAEDQGIFFASFYGQLSYITEITGLINGIETIDYAWNQMLTNYLGAHLQGLRVRPKALSSLVGYSIDHYPSYAPLSQFTPVLKNISQGLMIYGSYNYPSPLEAYPSMYNNAYIVDGLYFHAGSTVEWRLPLQCVSFESRVVCMDNGNPQSCCPVVINNQIFNIGDTINIPLKGQLKISTTYSEKGYLCFLKPKIKIKFTYPMYPQIISAQYGVKGTYKDVTSEIRNLTVYGPIEFKAGNEFFGDPAVGRAKEFILNFRTADEEKEIRVVENSPLTL